jgi:4-amino-4-deoxy-L-arabinose transferase-like glycosyltransferase
MTADASEASDISAGRLSLSCRLLVAVPAIVVAGLILLPFLNKAFNIDDLTFLLQAEHILKDPWHPTAFEMVFHGEKGRNSDGMVSGPIMALLLIPSILNGASEWIAHLTQYVVLVVGLLSLASLALRLRFSPIKAALATLLLACSPGVLAMTSSAMADVPAMSLGILAMERLYAWKEEGRWWQGAMAGLALALAALTRPHLLLLLAVGAIWLLADETWKGAWLRWFRACLKKTSLPFVIALVLIAATTYLLRDPHAGRNMAGVAVDWASKRLYNLNENLANLPLQWVLSFPLAIFWVGIHGRRFVGSRLALTVFLVGIELALATRWTKWFWLCVPATGLGLAVLVDILVDAWRRRDQLQFVCGLWLVIAAPAVVYHHLPVKYLVPSAPAMALLVVRDLDLKQRLRTLYLVTPVVVACVLLSLLIVQADAAQAEIGRRGGQLIAERVHGSPDKKVWLDGAWGFQWYGMKAGATPMTTTPPFPQPGDLIVVGPQGKLTSKLAPHRTRLFVKDYNTRGGRVMQDGAGFHSNPAGPFPWSWGKSSRGKLEVFAVDPTEP